ncbi:MAG: DUF4199 domain-containing protein [Bacteroidales bacterium]|nr:DUF4199 domain-containing protein [Bacteroidales bacterium]MCL2739205.1 DUF4199 domain-containing protein [Bacteroidales bacterium]
MKTEFWNSVAVNGLLLAIVSVIFTLLQTVVPGYNLVLTIVKLVATISVLYFFMKQYSREQEYFSYGNGFKYGFTVSFCSAIAFAVYVFVHHAYLFPETMEQQMQAAMQTMERYGSSGSLDLEQLGNSMPVIATFGLFFYALIWGLIVSAILAGFTKKEQPPFYDSEDEE